MGKLYVIEGLDALGKTTVAKTLAERLKGQYIKPLPKEFVGLSRTQRANIDPMRRFIYYLGAYLDASKEIKESEDEEIFVSDRCEKSMLVYNNVLSGKDLTHIINEFDFVKPEMIFRLVGDEEVRRARIKTRDKNSNIDLLMLENASFFKKIKERYDEVFVEAPLILSTGRDVKEVVDEIMGYIECKIVDMHLHSAFVNNGFNPTSIVQQAKSKRIMAIAITDHETTEAVELAMNIGRQYGIEVMSGVEISTSLNGTSYHILGYDFNLNHEGLQRLLAEQRKQRYIWAKSVIDILRENGWCGDYDELMEISNNKFVGKENIVRYIINHSRNKNRAKKYEGNEQQRVQEFIKENFRGGRSPSKHKRTNPISAIKMIREAEGVPLLAHPAEHLKPGKDDYKIEELVKQGLKGIEAYSDKASLSQIEYYLILANKMGILVSGGSNYHDRGIGGREKQSGFVSGGYLVAYPTYERIKNADR